MGGNFGLRSELIHRLLGKDLVCLARLLQLWEFVSLHLDYLSVRKELLFHG